MIYGSWKMTKRDTGASVCNFQLAYRCWLMCVCVCTCASLPWQAGGVASTIEPICESCSGAELICSSGCVSVSVHFCACDHLHMLITRVCQCMNFLSMQHALAHSRDGVHSYASKRQDVRVLLHCRTLIIKTMVTQIKKTQQENEAADMWAIKAASRFLVPAKEKITPLQL